MNRTHVDWEPSGEELAYDAIVVAESSEWPVGSRAELKRFLVERSVEDKEFLCAHDGRSPGESKGTARWRLLESGSFRRRERSFRRVVILAGASSAFEGAIQAF